MIRLYSLAYTSTSRPSAKAAPRAMGLLGLRRDVCLVLDRVGADSADSRRSDVVDAVADDAAEAESRTASAQGLHLSLILCRGNGQLRIEVTIPNPQGRQWLSRNPNKAKGMNECDGCRYPQGDDATTCFSSPLRCYWTMPDRTKYNRRLDNV